MAIGKRNSIRVVILFAFALSMLGFRFTPDRPAEPVENSPSLRNHHYIDAYIWWDLLAYDGNHWIYGTSPQVPVSLQITGMDINLDYAGGIIHEAQAFAFIPVNSTHPAGVTVYMGALMSWKISGYFYPSPDCSLELTIDHYKFPGIAITCGPFIGCMSSVDPEVFAPGIEITVPLNKGYSTGKAGVTSTMITGNLHVAIVNADLIDETCDSIYSGLP
ncbi:hypothetical protein KA005_29960 [bacterium]|nr:hypothetical protein [bacterium]